MERQAIQAMLLDVTRRMAPGQTLPVVRSRTPQQLKPRAYSPAQVRAIVARQDPRNALATEIVYASGIRAHELLTLGRPAEQPPDDRRGQSRLTGTAAEGMKFAGRDGVVYTVVGKGGLVREVLLPHGLAERLEARRLDAPERVVDRGVRYLQRYDLGGGHAFSTSFSRASMEALGKSRGAHGLRHRYIQDALMHHAEQSSGCGRRRACTTPSRPPCRARHRLGGTQGHLRPPKTSCKPTYVDHPPAFQSNAIRRAVPVNGIPASLEAGPTTHRSRIVPPPTSAPWWINVRSPGLFHHGSAKRLFNALEVLTGLPHRRRSRAAEGAWLIRAWYIETVGGCEFGPYGDEIEAHADAVMRRIERPAMPGEFGEYAVYARTELDGTPDLDDIRTRRSFEIG